MRKAVGILSLVATLLVASVSSALAVSIQSAAGETICSSGPGCPSPVVNLNPNAAWTVPPSATTFWVSYANTVPEHGGITPPNTTIAGSPTAIFTDTFSVAVNSTLSLRVWADDTAQVKLDGSPIGPAPSAGLGAACTSAGITCTGGGTLITPATILTTGSHTLEFDVFQLGDDSFGLMYNGSTVTPEPASILLVGSALAAVGVASRRRWVKK